MFIHFNGFHQKQIYVDKENFGERKIIRRMRQCMDLITHYQCTSMPDMP